MEELVVQDSEGDLRGRAGSQQEAGQTEAQPGPPPDQREEAGGEEEVLHVDGHVPGHVDAVRLASPVDISGEVVDVENVEPPAGLTLVSQGSHQVGLGAAGSKPEQCGVQGDDDGVDACQSEVSVHIEQQPHPTVTPTGLVQLLHGVKCQQTASDHKESVHSNQSIPHDCGRHAVSGLPSGPSAQREGPVAADVTILPEDVAQHYPGYWDVLEAVDTGEVPTGASTENLPAVVVGREALHDSQILLRQVLDLEDIYTHVQHWTCHDQESENNE